MESPAESRALLEFECDSAPIAEAAATSFQRFYPQAKVNVDARKVGVEAAGMSVKQLRTAWLAHVYTAMHDAQRARARHALLGDLFL